MKNKNLLNCKVVMLPVVNKSFLHLNLYNNKLFVTDYLTYGNEESGQRHLYLVSKRDIKPDDWCLLFDDFGKLFTDRPQQYKPEKYHVLNKGLRKIEATTDPSLKYPVEQNVLGEKFNDYFSIPQIPQSFIGSYEKANGKIEEVNIEMEVIKSATFEPCVEFLIPKTREDNTVIIHQSKTYTRGEVSVLLNQLSQDTYNFPVNRSDRKEYLNKWIEENL